MTAADVVFPASIMVGLQKQWTNKVIGGSVVLC